MKCHLKAIVFVLLAVCLLISSVAPAFAAEDVCLFDAKKGESFEVAVSDKKDETLKQASETLCAYLAEITGQTFRVVSADAQSEATLLLRYTDSLNASAAGAFRLHFEDGVFCIDGADARGVWNGVYGFLERICNIKMYSADVKPVPKADRITVASDFDFTYLPTLEYADTDWISPHDLEFSLANGLNGAYSPLEAVHGGKVKYLWFCHSLTSGIVPQTELFDSHPEYFALNKDGTRAPTQLCLSNPAVIARAKSDVLNKLKTDYDPKAGLNIVSVTQADNQDYCLCENCTALAKQYGGQSGLMIWFVNQIADAVAPEYPDAVVDTFAYQYTRQAPIGIEPRKNVCVRLCSIECCFSHALNDPNCENNVKFMKDLEDWSKISNRLYVWDYATDFLQTLGIFPNFGVIRENTQVFKTHHVVGIYEEGNYYASSCNTEFADLRAFLHARNMRDDLTAEEELKIRNESLNAYYGAGGDEIAQFLDDLTEHAGNEEGHLYIYSEMRSVLHDITRSDAERMDALWEKAIQDAEEAGDEVSAKRIKRSRIGWRYYESCAGVGDFEGFFGFPNIKANAKLISDIKSVGTDRYNEGTSMAEVLAKPFLTPNAWDDFRTDKKVEDVYTPAVIIGIALVVLALAAAVVAAMKKHQIAALLLVLCGVVALLDGSWASSLFIVWDNLPLYAVINASLLLSISGFGMLAAWAHNGCKFPRGVRLVLTILITLLVSALPYELVILCVNTLKYHGQKPVYSITVSAFVLMGVMLIDLVFFLVEILRKHKRQQPADEPAAPEETPDSEQETAQVEQ